MLINVPLSFPARQVLEQEGINFLDNAGSLRSKILKVAIVNLMPKKIATETHLMRLLGQAGLPIEITWVRMQSHQVKTVPQSHMLSYYESSAEAMKKEFDALIITGAPVEHLPFEEVNYWEELVVLMDWALVNVPSLMHICWGSQAALYHQFGIQKQAVTPKKFGVFAHQALTWNCPLTDSLGEVFYVPQARFTEIRREDIEKVPQLQVLSASREAGMDLLVTLDGRQVFIMGHPEYDATALHEEYLRDLALDLPIPLPVNFYPNDDPARPPAAKWQNYAAGLFRNWINQYVSQAEWSVQKVAAEHGERKQVSHRLPLPRPLNRLPVCAQLRRCGSTEPG